MMPIARRRPTWRHHTNDPPRGHWGVGNGKKKTVCPSDGIANQTRFVHVGPHTVDAYVATDIDILTPMLLPISM